MVENQMNEVQGMAHHSVNGLSQAYRYLWQGLIEKRRMELSHLF